MGISINGPSGIDTAHIIDSLVALEQQKVIRIEEEKSAYQVKIDAYSKLKSFLSDISAKAAALSAPTGFDLFQATTSNDIFATVAASVGAIEGRYDLRVFQLAQNEKMISANALIADQNAALTSYGMTAGTISVDGVEITIDDNDTLQDLRMKINSAKHADGSRLGVTASVLKLSDTNFRLVLSANESSSQGIAYQDVSGTILQGLGIIQDAAGSKGNVSQTLQSGSDIAASFNTLAVGAVIQYAGTDRGGNQVTGTFIKAAGSTADDLAAHMAKTFHGMVDVTVGGDGTFSVSDLVSGSSQLTISSFVMDGAAVDFGIVTAGAEGKGVLSTGKDAYFSVDDIFMTSTGNSASGFIPGVTFDFKKASVSEVTTLEISRDYAGIQKKVTDILDSYNALMRYVKSSTAYGDPDDEKSTDGALAGDMTAQSVVAQVRSMLQTSFSALGGTYNSLTMVGVKTNSKSGELSLDGDTFKKAIETNFDEVMRLFVKNGYSSNTAVQYGRSTKDTQSGVYTLEEVDAEHFRIQRSGDTAWYLSDARAGEILTFSSGPAAGLSITAAAGSLGGTPADFTFSKGVSVLLDDLMTKLTDGYDGLVTLRQESWQKRMRGADDRIMTMETRIEKYRERLVNQFTAMEMTLSSLQSQSSNMMSQLSAYRS